MGSWPSRKKLSPFFREKSPIVSNTANCNSMRRLDAVAAMTGTIIKTATTDACYAYAKVFAGMEQRAIEAVIPAKAEPIRSPVPARRFRYDAKHDTLKCAAWQAAEGGPCR